MRHSKKLCANRHRDFPGKRRWNRIPDHPKLCCPRPNELEAVRKALNCAASLTENPRCSSGWRNYARLSEPSIYCWHSYARPAPKLSIEAMRQIVSLSNAPEVALLPQTFDVFCSIIAKTFTYVSYEEGVCVAIRPQSNRSPQRRTASRTSRSDDVVVPKTSAISHVATALPATDIAKLLVLPDSASNLIIGGPHNENFGFVVPRITNICQHVFKRERSQGIGNSSNSTFGLHASSTMSRRICATPKSEQLTLCVTTEYPAFPECSGHAANRIGAHPRQRPPHSQVQLLSALAQSRAVHRP